MALDFYFREDTRDPPIAIDDYGRAFYTHVLHPVQCLFLPYSIRVGDNMALIDEKVVRQRVFIAEFPMRSRAIGADSEYDCIELPEPGKGVAKIARLSRSPGGIVLRVKKEDDLASAKP